MGKDTILMIQGQKVNICQFLKILISYFNQLPFFNMVKRIFDLSLYSVYFHHIEYNVPLFHV